MGLIVPFSTIHGSHCTISINFLSLSTVLSAKSFQFQQNKRIPNRPMYTFLESKKKKKKYFLLLESPILCEIDVLLIL